MPTVHTELSPPTYAANFAKDPPVELEFANSVQASLQRIGATPSGALLLSSIADLVKSGFVPGSGLMAARIREHGRSVRASVPVGVLIVSRAFRAQSDGWALVVDRSPGIELKLGELNSGRPSSVIVPVMWPIMQGFVDLSQRLRAESFDVALSRALLTAVKSLVGARLGPSIVASVHTTLHGEPSHAIRRHVSVDDLLVHGGADELALARATIVSSGLSRLPASATADPTFAHALSRESRNAEARSSAAQTLIYRTLFTLGAVELTVTKIAAELAHPLPPLVGQELMTHPIGGHGREVILHAIQGPTYQLNPSGDIGDVGPADLNAPDASFRLERNFRFFSLGRLSSLTVSAAEAVTGRAALARARDQRAAAIVRSRNDYEVFMHISGVNHPGFELTFAGWMFWKSLDQESAGILARDTAWMPACIAHL